MPLCAVTATCLYPSPGGYDLRKEAEGHSGGQSSEVVRGNNLRGGGMTQVAAAERPQGGSASQALVEMGTIPWESGARKEM